MVAYGSGRTLWDFAAVFRLPLGFCTCLQEGSRVSSMRFWIFVIPSFGGFSVPGAELRRS